MKRKILESFKDKITTVCYFYFCRYQSVHDERLLHHPIKSANQHFWTRVQALLRP